MLKRLRGLLRRRQRPDVVAALRERVNRFRHLVDRNSNVLELMADAERRLGGDVALERGYLEQLDGRLAAEVEQIVDDLERIEPRRHRALADAFLRIRGATADALAERPIEREGPRCIQLASVGRKWTGLIGQKMARLAELEAARVAPVPDGFVLTATAFDEIARGVELDALIAGIDLHDAALAHSAGALRSRLASRPLPRRLIRTIRKALRRFDRDTRFAVRSSALGEDGDLSFAGIHQSLMNVPREGVPEAYRSVVASLFSERALRYRRDHDVPLRGDAMAVGVMRMVPAVAGGVLYTFDPGEPQADEILVAAAWGHGSTVVEGAGNADRYRVARRPPHELLHAAIADKVWTVVPDPDGGLRREPVDPRIRNTPCLASAGLAKLAAIALGIERFARCAQDIEWAIDDRGKLWILQARPLRMGPPSAVRPAELTQTLARTPVLLRGRGGVACGGVATGRVAHVASASRIQHVAPGSVIVTPHPTPDLSVLLDSAAALVADSGSPTGHLAALARERHVPMLVATETGTARIPEGSEVTVDADENVVYEGRVDELVRHALLHGHPYQGSRELRLLRRMLAHVTPLTLSDPGSGRFRAERCESYHDLIRYAHEKAVLALTDLSALDARSTRQHLRRLRLDIPLGLSVLDLGGGLVADAPAPEIELDHVACLPLSALLEALVASGAWETAPAGMDLSTLLSSATRVDTLALSRDVDVRRNLAVVSRRHMHLSLFLGYHFNVIDCFVGRQAEDSYLLFRFVGGASTLERRVRRLDLIDEILTRYGFAVERAGDLLLGRLHGIRPATIQRRLALVGRLVGFTRQLDVRLRSDTDTLEMIRQFKARHPEPRASAPRQG